jgi:Zn-dependent peptidase ImmA (M78 family)/transcriptional regulator with XRE-family HTH domain
MDLQAVGERVRRERERAALNQRELAGRAGLSQPTLARIELGIRSRLTIAELDRIATALEVPLRELTSGSPVRQRLRVVARMTTVADEVREAALGRAADILVLDDRLDRLGVGVAAEASRFQQTIELPSPDPAESPERQGGRFAEAVRLALDLGGAPLVDAAELAERLMGVDTALVDFPDGVDGFTLIDPARGAILIVLSTKAVTERQRFTLAHEVGHLLFGDGAEEHQLDGARTPAEKRCDAFARHLLAPQEGIRAWLGLDGPAEQRGEVNVNERLCALLSRHFGVSLPVILIQLERMGLLSREQTEQLRGPTGAQLAQRYGWGRQYDREQEVGRTTRPPRRVLERAITAYHDGKLGVRVIAALEGRDPVEMEAALVEAGIVPATAPVRRADVDRLLARSRTSHGTHAPTRTEAEEV